MATFQDNRPSTIAQTKLWDSIHNKTANSQSQGSFQFKSHYASMAQNPLQYKQKGKWQTTQRMANHEEEDLLQGKFKGKAPVQRMVASEDEEDLLQGKFKGKAPVQRMVTSEDEEDLLQGKFSQQPIQKQEEETQPNNTGLPDKLKSGIENLSGYSLDDVNVHYNSAKPAQLQAHAYAQGTDIHLGPGQEKHLPHEAWHVVQQKQGRVKPTMQMKGGVNVNDDVGLEREADVMGRKANNMNKEVDIKKMKMPVKEMQVTQRFASQEEINEFVLKNIPDTIVPRKIRSKKIPNRVFKGTLLSSFNKWIIGTLHNENFITDEYKDIVDETPDKKKQVKVKDNRNWKSASAFMVGNDAFNEPDLLEYLNDFIDFLGQMPKEPLAEGTQEVNQGEIGYIGSTDEQNIGLYTQGLSPCVAVGMQCYNSDTKANTTTLAHFDSGMDPARVYEMYNEIVKRTPPSPDGEKRRVYAFIAGGAESYHMKPRPGELDGRSLYNALLTCIQDEKKMPLVRFLEERPSLDGHEINVQIINRLAQDGMEEVAMTRF